MGVISMNYCTAIIIKFSDQSIGFAIWHCVELVGPLILSVNVICVGTFVKLLGYYKNVKSKSGQQL